MSAGALFTEDFLLRGLPASPAWRLDEIADLEARFRDILAAIKKPEGLAEEPTKQRIIEPMLAALGWAGAYTVQENLDRRGRGNVPDYGFFPDSESFAHRYGIESEDDIRYILSTFPIVERKDRAAHAGVYLTAELIVWYFRALAAGDPDSLAPEDALIRAAKRG